MKASLLARLASFFLVVALLLPTLNAVAADAPKRARYNKAGVHRPVYKKYKPGHRWIFQKR
ncbi:hypothetical protein [Hymenobacter sp. CRA2]|uniref:hypothetical protein n=1 Tax=Hymenobacter sp. CRA2 TaxID=1955620 RepID=UPI00098F08B9|nr:hypothetical protein [Hymenobacter sp. CRA2]OON70472.1 hypothetical protein B0919_00100 [Hymenobacter sp. CRA2]